MKTYNELVAELKKIKSKGFITTHRSGNTGIGKTLEDLLGIEENNFAGPDGVTTELKAARKNATSMLTLFTKSPLPRHINSKLVGVFGYVDSKKRGRKILHTTLDAKSPTLIKGNTKMMIGIEANGIKIIWPDKKSKIPNPYWEHDTLKDRFEKKYQELLYVKADSRGTGKLEEFHYNEAWLMKGFNFKNFIKLLKSGIVKVDVRIGKYSDGRTHDHGTGFRVMPDNLDKCFMTRKNVL